ncbi:TlpA family protein disulfide reductase [Leptospira wolffii]|uniref:TlpA family protein disulfide reductase n=1 Tax=Leptospira wolffii TaxID=409998 RepID=A0ABV5BNV9_9LEPT|nr:TlpA disulfide reductase family protein [Leptospira wolffii]TGL52570.1 TlpA family protein disulfide reductase [Leptospira wolffii]
MRTIGAILVLLICYPVFSQKENAIRIPNIPLYTLDLERKTLYQELDRLGNSDLVVVNFTSSDCPPCKEEVPKLLEYSRKWNSDPKRIHLHLWIVFLGDDSDSASKFASELGVQNKSAVFFDSLQTSMRILEFPGTPTTFLLRNKNILFREYGYTNENWNKLVSLLESQRR